MQSVRSGEEKEPPPPQRGWVRSFAPPRNCARRAIFKTKQVAVGISSTPVRRQPPARGTRAMWGLRGQMDGRRREGTRG